MNYFFIINLKKKIYLFAKKKTRFKRTYDQNVYLNRIRCLDNDKYHR